eukprot:760229-Rhodomonas_salina.1
MRHVRPGATPRAICRLRAQARYAPTPFLRDVRYSHRVCCYAIRGTGAAYGATPCLVLTERMVLPGRDDRVVPL